MRRSFPAQEWGRALGHHPACRWDTHPHCHPRVLTRHQATHWEHVRWCGHKIPHHSLRWIDHDPRFAGEETEAQLYGSEQWSQGLCPETLPWARTHDHSTDHLPVTCAGFLSLDKRVVPKIRYRSCSSPSHWRRREVNIPAQNKVLNFVESLYFPWFRPQIFLKAVHKEKEEIRW